MDMTSLLFGIIFIITGFIFAFGKVYTRLNGWKYSSQEEKNRVNIDSLCKNVGAMISLSGVIFLLKGIVERFSNSIFIWVMIAWFVIAGLDVWYISKSEHYIQK